MIHITPDEHRILVDAIQDSATVVHKGRKNMNKRIKELLKQSCGFEYDEDGHELTPILVGKDLEKFAQLIVRECAEQVKNLRVNDYGISGEEIIREHFGVEE